MDRQLLGMVIGQVVWALCYVAAWLQFGGVFEVIAAPVSILGWLLIWGDGPGHIELVDTTAFTVAFGLLFYGALGAGVARLWAKRRPPG